MRYVRAQDVFPAEVLELVQQYADGEYVYIPRREGAKKNWGEQTDSRQLLAIRNEEIFAAYHSGWRVADLAGRFFLSEKSIYRILAEKKRRTE